MTSAVNSPQILPEAVPIEVVVAAISMRMASLSEEVRLPPDLVITVSSGDETVDMAFLSVASGGDCRQQPDPSALFSPQRPAGSRGEGWPDFYRPATPSKVLGQNEK